jgi:hypothetical protein
MADSAPADKGRRRAHRDAASDAAGKKRRCISSACVPCRKRKSKVSVARRPAPAPTTR